MDTFFCATTNSLCKLLTFEGKSFALCNSLQLEAREIGGRRSSWQIYDWFCPLPSFHLCLKCRNSYDVKERIWCSNLEFHQQIHRREAKMRLSHWNNDLAWRRKLQNWRWKLRYSLCVQSSRFLQSFRNFRPPGNLICKFFTRNLVTSQKEAISNCNHFSLVGELWWEFNTIKQKCWSSVTAVVCQNENDF